jgi:hypothetical protein
MIGMPQDLLLHEFGSKVWDAFGHPPYLVGSALTTKSDWRDVDVRLILPDEEYRDLGLGQPGDAAERSNAKWIALVLAFQALGQKMTGLPIDFQIQQQSWANKKYPGPRSALVLVPWRRQAA